MDDVSLSPSLLNKLLWAAMLVGAYILRRYQHKMDRLELAQHSFVTREELNRDLALMREDALQRHKENLGRLDQINASQLRVHERIDRAIAK